MNLAPGLWAISAQYLTPSGSLGYWRGFARGFISNHEIIRRIKSNPHRKFDGGLAVYDITRIAD